VLVSSGAVSAGVAKIGLSHRPHDTAEKQATAAVGQNELMKIYSRFFADYGITIGQILMTKDVFENEERRKNAENTFNALLKFGCVPIVNENDSIATEELNFGGNDKLAAYVALVCRADILLNLSDVDGLFDSDPRKNPDAKRYEHLSYLDLLNEGLEVMDSTATSMCMDNNMELMVFNMNEAGNIVRAMKGEKIGTIINREEKE
jgi:glutamate 5-kinase